MQRVTWPALLPFVSGDRHYGSMYFWKSALLTRLRCKIMPAMTNAERTALSPPDFCLDHCRERSENPARHPGVGRRHLAHGRETLVMEPSGFLTGVEATPGLTEHHFGGGKERHESDTTAGTVSGHPSWGPVRAPCIGV